MSTNNQLIFKVMITFPDLLKKEIEDYNEQNNTDFTIVEVIYDDVLFCKIGVSKYKPSDIFDLGYGLAALQYSLREKGKLDW